MQFRNIATASILALALAACGGGDSSAPAPTGGGPVATPAPPPAPAPAPAPPPPPTPPPPPDYPTYSELLDEQLLQTTCGGRERFREEGGNNNADVARSITSPFGPDVLLISDRDEPNYSFSSDVDYISPFSVSFDQSDRNLDFPDSETYQRLDPGPLPEFFRTATPLVASQPLRYAQYGTLRYYSDDRTYVDLRCAFGVRTFLDDIPVEASLYEASETNLRVQLNGPFDASLGAMESNIALTFSPDDQNINFIFELRSALDNEVLDLGIYGGTGSLDNGRTNFGGIIVDASDNQVGEFNGWFFGPGGTEMAISVTIEETLPDNSLVIATGVIFLRQ